jgi:hypothetical protein
MVNYVLILSTNYPTAQWTLDGFDYSGLTWLDASPKPTKAELDALWEPTQTQIANAKTKEQAAKTSALNKLKALGLTEEEALALGVIK